MKKEKVQTILRTVVLVVCSVSLLCTTPVMAVESEVFEPVDSVYAVEKQPRYKALVQFTANLGINSSGYASCVADAYADFGYTCDTTMELQKKSGSVWKTVKAWNSSGRTNSFDKGYYVTSGYDYRLKLSADVYTSGGSWVEGATTYSQIVHY